jgi:hypothetical protein
MSKKELLHKISEIVVDMSNVLSSPVALPIAKEYARSNGIKQIEELIESYLPENTNKEMVKTFPIKRKRK